jgi:hypothetical protein
VPYSSSEAVYRQIRAPVFYLSLVGAGHLAPIIGNSPWTPVLDDAVARFIDATVAGRRDGVSSLAAELSASPLVRFEAKS